MLARINRMLFAALLGLGVPTLGSAETGRWNSLLKKNPFYNEPPAPAPIEKAPPVELKGVLVEGKVTWLNLYNADTKQSFWVQKGDKAAAYIVQDFDAARETVTLRFKERLVSVTLKESGVKLSPGMNHGLMAMNSTKGSYVRLSPAFVASEKQRVERVADEIRERRELRQKQMSKLTRTES